MEGKRERKKRKRQRKSERKRDKEETKKLKEKKTKEKAKRQKQRRKRKEAERKKGKTKEEKKRPHEKKKSSSKGKSQTGGPHTPLSEGTHRKVVFALDGREVWRAVDLEFLQRPLEENQPHVRYNQQIEPPREPQHQHCHSSYASRPPGWRCICSGEVIPCVVFAFTSVWSMERRDHTVS